MNDASEKTIVTVTMDRGFTVYAKQAHGQYLNCISEILKIVASFRGSISCRACPASCLHTCNNSRVAERILMKFYTVRVLKKNLLIHFRLDSFNNHFTYEHFLDVTDVLLFT